MEPSNQLVHFMVAFQPRNSATIAHVNKLLCGRDDTAMGGAAHADVERVLQEVAPAEAEAYRFLVSTPYGAKEKEFAEFQTLLDAKYFAPTDLVEPLRMLLPTGLACARTARCREFELKICIDVPKRNEYDHYTVSVMTLRFLNLVAPAGLLTPNQPTAYVVHERTEYRAIGRPSYPTQRACETVEQVVDAIRSDLEYRWKDWRGMLEGLLRPEYWAVGKEVNNAKGFKVGEEGIVCPISEAFVEELTKEVTEVCKSLKLSTDTEVQQELTPFKQLFEMRKVNGTWKMYSKARYAVHLLQIVQC